MPVDGATVGFIGCKYPYLISAFCPGCVPGRHPGGPGAERIIEPVGVVKGFAPKQFILRWIMEIKTVRLSIPEDCNIIVGQSHFIKTIEDLYEIFTSGCPHCRFGIAFCEASGPCLIRVDGNDPELSKRAAENAMSMGAGHSFVCLLKDAFPINILNAIKSCAEVCTIYCATANPVEVIIVETDQGRGVIGVVDGYSPKGVEASGDVQKRKEFLRTIGYKR